MPQATDLMGVGMSAELARELGNTPNVVTCAGTTLGTATTIKTTNSELSASGSATGAVLPTSAKIGTPYFVFVSSSTSAVVYVPSGSTLNTVTDDTLTLAQKKSAILMQYKRNAWSALVTA